MASSAHRMLVVSAVQAFVAAWTLVLLGFTLWEARRTAKATRDAADATLLSAQGTFRAAEAAAEANRLATHSRRPYLSRVTVTASGHHDMIAQGGNYAGRILLAFEIQNIGASAALVELVGFREWIVPHRRVDEPIGPFFMSAWPGQDVLVGEKFRREIVADLDRHTRSDVIEAIRRGELTFYVVGRLTYSDLAGSTWVCGFAHRLVVNRTFPERSFFAEEISSNLWFHRAETQDERKDREAGATKLA